MPRTTDTKERMIEVAREMANESGWESLNLHHIAERLGIKPPSLYNHISSLEDLRAQLILAAHQGLSEVLLGAADGHNGGEAIRAMGIAYRKYILENPGLLPALSISTESWKSPVRQVSDQTLEGAKAVLDPFGLSETEKVHALRMLRSLVHGFATLELSGGFGLPEDREESFSWMLDRLVRSLSGD